MGTAQLILMQVLNTGVIIGILWLQQEFGLLAHSALGIMLPTMQADLDFGTVEAGWLGAARGLVTTLFVLPASLVLVRFRSKWIYTALLTLAGVGLLAASRTPSFLLLYAAFLVYISGAALIQVPVAIIRLQWIRPQEFATVMGLGQSMNAGGQSASIMAIPWLLLWLGGWRSLFVALGAVLLGLTALWIGLGRSRESAEPRPADVGLSSLRQVLRRRDYVLIGLAMFGNSTAWNTTLLFLPTYLVQTRGMDLAIVGVVEGLMPLGGLFACLAGGALSDRLGRRKPIIWPIGLLGPLAYLSLLIPLPLPLLFVAALATGYCAWGPWPALQTTLYELPDVKAEEVAIGQSLAQTISTFGTMTGPIAAGLLAQFTGSLALGMGLMGLLTGMTGVIGLALPETGPRAAWRAKGGPAAMAR